LAERIEVKELTDERRDLLSLAQNTKTLNALAHQTADLLPARLLAVVRVNGMIRASCMRSLDIKRKRKGRTKGRGRERGGEDARAVTADSEGGAGLPTSQQAGRTWYNTSQIRSYLKLDFLHDANSLIDKEVKRRSRNRELFSASNSTTVS